MELSIRPAAITDAEQLGAVHVRAWQAGYRGVMLDSFLDGLDADARADYWRSALGGASSDVAPGGPEAPTTLVAEIGGLVVAMASVGRNRSVEVGGPTGELWSLNADPVAWGSGAATALHAEACAALVQLGHDAAILWVVDRNPRARRFYEREGWRFDGTSKAEMVGGSEIVEVRYQRNLR